MPEERLRTRRHIGGGGQVRGEARQQTELPASVHLLTDQAPYQQEGTARYSAYITNRIQTIM